MAFSLGEILAASMGGSETRKCYGRDGMSIITVQVHFGSGFIERDLSSEELRVMP